MAVSKVSFFVCLCFLSAFSFRMPVVPVCRSSESLPSIGIGDASINETSQVRPKLISDGLVNTDDKLCDSVVVLIFCPEHRKVATIKTRREHIVWVPFLQLREGQSWTEATSDCIQRTIGRQDTELNEEEAVKQAPSFAVSYFEVTQIQVPSVNNFTRICQLVTIESGPSNCCTQNRQIEWIPLETLATTDKNHWGPELQKWCKMLEESQPPFTPNIVMMERSIAKQLKFFAEDQKTSAEYKALFGKLMICF